MQPPDPLAGFQKSDPSRAVATRAVKDLVRKHFGLDADAPVFVAEISCGEVDCPDTETVIAVFLDGGRQEFRLDKAVAALTGADIARAAERHQTR